MLQANFRPITTWPRTATPAEKRKTSPFRATYLKTLDLLEFELGQLGAQDVTIYADVHPSQIRNDGWLKAGATPTTPGVIVTFETKQGQISMPCDTYKHWQDNMRAIALSLEALRAVDRYGVTSSREQYQGFRALPAPSAQMSLDEAAQLLVTQSGSAYTVDHLLSDREAVQKAYKIAAGVHHPDRRGDNHMWNLIVQARDLLSSDRAERR